VSSWDVFHSDRMEVERGLSTPQVRAARAAGSIREDDLVRAAGSSAPWSRFTELPELNAPESSAAPEMAAEPTPEPAPEPEPEPLDGGDEAFAMELDPDGLLDATYDNPLPSDGFDEEDPEEELGPIDPRDEDEEAADFTLARGSAETIEELDLAAMVDVAFQLVLFFLVTATTILYKSLEVPKPNPDKEQQEPVAQGKRTLEEMKKEFILVQIDAAGAFKLDGEPIAQEALLEKMRRAREETARKTMLLSADFTTMHLKAVFAYDAANDIGLGIAIARPADPAGGGVTPVPSTPAPAPASKKAAGG